MEMIMSNEFSELNSEEMFVAVGGKKNSEDSSFSLMDFVEKINPLNLLEFVYQVGTDMGKASVQFGRELYGFYRDVRTILEK